MPEIAATTAYQFQRPDRPQRNWLGKTAEQLRADSEQQQQFWLVFSAPNATLRPAVFRLPSRDYPFLVTGAVVNVAATALKLYATDEQLASYNVPISAIAGGSDGERQLFKWSQPILLMPHSAWRLELTLAEPSGLALTTIVALRGVKLGNRK